MTPKYKVINDGYGIRDPQSAIRYSLVSLMIHILLLFLMRDYFFTTPLNKTYKELQVEIRPPVEEQELLPEPVVKKVKTAKKKSIPVVKPDILKKRFKKIPREVELPPRTFDKNTKISMFKDGGGVRGKPKKRPLKREESPVTTSKERQVPSRKIILAQPKKKTVLITPPRSPSHLKRETKTPLPRKSKELVRPFQTGDIFLQKPPAPKPDPKEKEGNIPDLSQALANLDQYIDADKFDKFELFGDSMLTFTDDNFRYLWYGRIVKNKVVKGWFPPIAARLGLTGKARVTFTIHRDGSVDKIELAESTGNKSLDRAALNSIKSARPFPKLPDDYQYDQLGVVFSFWYNVSHPGS